MAQIVRYTAKNEVQKLRRRRTSSTDPALMDSDESRGGGSAEGSGADNGAVSSPISRFGHLLPDQTAFDDRLLRALGTLDSVARSCLLLRVVLDSPYKEISLVLGIPQGTAMSHVDRSRRALRIHLTGQNAPAAGGATA